MSDTADKPSDDHWGRLAHELGLEPDPPRPASVKVERPAVDEPRTDEGQTGAPFETDDRPSGRRRHGGERQADRTAVTELEPPAQPALLDDEPQARPRRGRKSADRVADEPADDRAADEPDLSGRPEPPSDEGGEAGDDGGTKRRRRRRSRRKKGKDQPDAGAAEVESADAGEPGDVDEEEPVSAPDEEEAAPEVIADWNVPSWNELIASLHRPER